MDDMSAGKAVTAEEKEDMLASVVAISSQEKLLSPDLSNKYLHFVQDYVDTTLENEEVLTLEEC